MSWWGRWSGCVRSHRNISERQVCNRVAKCRWSSSQWGSSLCRWRLRACTAVDARSDRTRGASRYRKSWIVCPALGSRSTTADLSTVELRSRASYTLLLLSFGRVSLCSSLQKANTHTPLHTRSHPKTKYLHLDRGSVLHESFQALRSRDFHTLFWAFHPLCINSKVRNPPIWRYCCGRGGGFRV